MECISANSSSIYFLWKFQVTFPECSEYFTQLKYNLHGTLRECFLLGGQVYTLPPAPTTTPRYTHCHQPLLPHLGIHIATSPTSPYYNTQVYTLSSALTTTPRYTYTLPPTPTTTLGYTHCHQPLLPHSGIHIATSPYYHTQTYTLLPAPATTPRYTHSHQPLLPHTCIHIAASPYYHTQVYPLSPAPTTTQRYTHCSQPLLAHPGIHIVTSPNYHTQVYTLSSAPATTPRHLLSPSLLPHLGIHNTSRTYCHTPNRDQHLLPYTDTSLSSGSSARLIWFGRYVCFSPSDDTEVSCHSCDRLHL